MPAIIAPSLSSFDLSQVMADEPDGFGPSIVADDIEEPVAVGAEINESIEQLRRSQVSYGIFQRKLSGGFAGSAPRVPLPAA